MSEQNLQEVVPADTPPKQESAIEEGGNTLPSSDEGPDTDLLPGQASPLAELEDNANRSFDDPNYDPLMGPLNMFGLYSGRIMAAVEGLKTNQLKRLLKCLITYPLEDVKLNKNNKLENEIYIMADRLLQAKYLMMMITAHEEENKRKQAAQEQKAAAQASEEAKEVSTVTEEKTETKTGE